MTDKRRILITTAVLIVAAVFVAFGIYRQETLIVFEKAVHVCTECIGLG